MNHVLYYDKSIFSSIKKTIWNLIAFIKINNFHDLTTFSNELKLVLLS
jgi:hypothetical protein